MFLALPRQATIARIEEVACRRCVAAPTRPVNRIGRHAQSFSTGLTSSMLGVAGASWMGITPLPRLHDDRISVLTRQRRLLSCTSAKSKQRSDPSPSAYEEQDDAIYVLEKLMHKRQILTSQRDASIDMSTAKELSDLDALEPLWRSWQQLQKSLLNVQPMTDPAVEADASMREMAEEEMSGLTEEIDACRRDIRRALLPRDPLDQQSALMEFRTGVGGDESAVFTAEVARMYQRFCAEVHPSDLNPDDDSGGGRFVVERISAISADVAAANDAYKEVILSIKGKGAYGMLRGEAGVQRVQRVPVTVSVTKIQTSTMAILVLPLDTESPAKAATAKDDIVDPKDVKEEVMRARGAGGQHVNKTESAVRLTHEPTGISVSMQDSRSQHSNRAKAWEILRARLTDRKMQQDKADVRSERRSQVSSMERNERVRTYNFMQDRVTDHRVPITTNDIDGTMEGEARQGGGLLLLLQSLKEHREGLLMADLREQVKQEVTALESAYPS